MSDFNSAFQTVGTLIVDFKANSNYYTSPEYQEAEVRIEFIDKFFCALGWDVNHEIQKNPQLQEVKIEKRQLQHGDKTQKRADYSFSLAPKFKQPMFFVEAKKPSRALRKNKDDYFQTSKYGWNAGTGISVLTDFEEFVIIDCRSKPDIDTILSTEIKYYRYTDFQNVELFEEIYWLFSHEAVEAGNIERFIDDLPKPRHKEKQLKLFGGGGQSIDESFLNYIDDKRQELASAFFKNNKYLDAYSLKEATQRTLDRIIFIRFLEDKSIEQSSIISVIATSKYPWEKFIEFCKALNAKYNGIVFKSNFIDAPHFLGADENLFRELCSELDNTNSPYDFNYIPIHILGNIYERFLGKVVVIENTKITIEDKPEVRKAGGVFYTPKYIVDFIVENTVGKIIDGKTPKQIAELTFADISCGSGSFLIGALEYLLDYHIHYYNKFPEQAKKDKCKFDTESGTWVLSIKQKQNILLNNIYGVDIDLQATEVTQLSLFLKMLEDETTATTNDMMVLFHDTILPNLSNNIKCGNSLIGTEILTSKLDLMLDEERKLNPFDFVQSFPNVFNKGGFDAIIGNPPYVKEYTEKEIFENVRAGKLKKYYQGKMDLWYFFVCFGIDILKNDGYLSYIAPNNWVSNSGAKILRNKIINDTQIEGLFDFNDFMVFKDASIQTMIINLKKSKMINAYSFIQQIFIGKKLKEIDVKTDLENQTKVISKIITATIDRNSIQNKFLKFNNVDADSILNKILLKKNFELNEHKEVAQGIVPNADVLSKKSLKLIPEDIVEKFELKAGIPLFVIPKGFFNNLSETEKMFIKPLYEPSDLSKYYFNANNKKEIIYLTKTNEVKDIPNLIMHLSKFKNILDERRETKQGKLKYYHLHWPRTETFFSNGEKILSVRKCTEPTFCFTDKPAYVMMSFNIIKTNRVSMKYLCGILNSTLIKFWLLKRGKMQGSIFQIDKEPILQIPIFVTTDTSQYNIIIDFVEKLIHAKEQLTISITERDREYIKQKISNLEQLLNNSIYNLYDITLDEIRVIDMSLI